LCAFTICEATVYDAQYSISQGSLKFHTSSLTHISLTNSATFLGGAYHTFPNGARFIGEQLQVDLSEVGNGIGISTARFLDAWALAVAVRLLGWTSGAVVLRPSFATITRETIGLAIPLGPAHAFAIFYLAYALVIIIIGASCVLLPANTSALPNSVRPAHLSGVTDAPAEKPLSELAAA
jgi:hypothetical protein